MGNPATTALHRVLDELEGVKRDRDEWKQQHENLLAMYRAQGEELAALKSLQSDATEKQP